MAVDALVQDQAPRIAVRPGGLAWQRSWSWWVVAVTVAGFAVSIGFAPSADAAPVQGLTWLLFLGSAVHIASTGWLFTFTAVRTHASTHRARYLIAPAGLIVGGATVAGLLSPRHIAVLLLGYFGWQFFHYQKQNLGLAALAAASRQAPSLTTTERKAIMATGWAGIVALLLHPGTLQLPLDPRLGWYPAVPFGITAIGFVSFTLVGLVALARRPAGHRPAPFCAIYLLALCFPLPIFAFASPYAAVGGMTIAHGLQYLVLVGLVAAGRPSGKPPIARLSGFVVAALVIGTALNFASHLHTGGELAHVVYGAYLGIVMAHFVVDAGVWRLRDPFPRRFLSDRAPYLFKPPTVSVTDASPDGVR